jgi:peptidoglycan biosynthesis protein MviN/MurJ (putative lipid II flippase)
MSRQLAAIVLVTGVGQVSALVKMWLVARLFGISTDLDAYTLAFVLPVLVSGVIGGTLQTGLFPVYAQMSVQKRWAALAALERRLFWSILGVGGAACLLILASADPLGRAIAAGATERTKEATIYVVRFAAFAVVLNTVGDYVGYLLALRKRFVWAAAAPIANAMTGAALLLAWPEGGLTNLALGTVLGILAQTTIVLSVLLTTGFSFFSGEPTAKLSIGPEVREILTLSGWMLPSVVFGSLTATLPPLLIARFDEGAVSAFGYAFRFHQSVLQLLFVAASPVVLARFSELIARRDSQSLDRLQRKALGLSIAIGAIAVALVGGNGEAILSLAFGYGRFDAVAASRVAEHWFWLTIGLGVSLYGNALAKRLQAAKGAKVLGVLALVSTLTLLLTVAALDQSLEEFSIPIAFTVAAVVTTLLLAVLIRANVTIR